MDVEWRRAEGTPVVDAAAAALLNSIRAEIDEHGPLTFERFMERALYDPAHGYYARSTERPTRAGDFLTAPELHPIFGQTLAVTIDEMWRRLARPSDFTLREYGAGTGALFVSLLEGLARLGSPLAKTIRYQPIDLPAQTARITDRLHASGHGDALRAPGSDRFTGVVVANEFLDALPVHRVIKMNGELREIYIDWREDRLTEVAGPLTDDRLTAAFRQIALSEGHRAEVNLRQTAWLVVVAHAVARGYVLVIDYGATAAELYGGGRANGTLRAFSGQRVSGDVFSEPGTRDITAHVDFNALERDARGAGFEVAGRRRSNEFLVASGLDDAYAAARAAADTDWDAAATLRSAVRRLLDPSALGGYQVVVLSKDAPVAPPLKGFGELPPHR